MDARQKLVEVLREVQYLGGLEENIADHRISNGVIVGDKQGSTADNLPANGGTAEGGGSMNSCKYCKADCALRGEENQKECNGYIPMTNADRIRSMSDEELAKILGNKCICPPTSECVNCFDCWLEWLQQPAETFAR